MRRKRKSRRKRRRGREEQAAVAATAEAAGAAALTKHKAEMSDVKRCKFFLFNTQLCQPIGKAKSCYVTANVFPEPTLTC